MSHPGTHKNGIGMVWTSKNVNKKKLKLLLTVILKHPVYSLQIFFCSQRWSFFLSIFNEHWQQQQISSHTCSRAAQASSSTYENQMLTDWKCWFAEMENDAQIISTNIYNVFVLKYKFSETKKWHCPNLKFLCRLPWEPSHLQYCTYHFQLYILMNGLKKSPNPVHILQTF